MQHIENYLENYLGIRGTDLSPVVRLFEHTTLRKNEYLLKVNQYARCISFVKTGYLRVFAFDQDGNKEITQWISNQDMFITDLASFVFEAPSRWNIQALSDCELYTISKENYQRIDTYVNNWPELKMFFIAKCFVTLENRVFEQLSMTAAQKVKQLLDTNPELFIQVPLHYIASMLGMPPETLSRVRRQLLS